MNSNLWPNPVYFEVYYSSDFWQLTFWYQTKLMILDNVGPKYGRFCFNKNSGKIMQFGKFKRHLRMSSSGHFVHLYQVNMGQCLFYFSLFGNIANFLGCDYIQIDFSGNNDISITVHINTQRRIWNKIINKWEEIVFVRN